MKIVIFILGFHKSLQMLYT